MAQKITGIDIGSVGVKAVRLKVGLRSGFECLDTFYEPIVQGEKDHAGQASEALKKLVLKNGLEGDQFIAAIPGQKVLRRFLKLPFTQRKKIDQVINFEIENHIPFSADDIITDYQLLSKEKDGANLFVQSAKKDDVEAFLKIFEDAGIELKYLDSELMALYSLLSLSFDDEKCRAVLDIGHRKTLFTVIKNGRVAYAHSIDFGGAYIDEKISEALRVSVEEAGGLKRGIEQDEETYRVIEDCIKELSYILRRDIISFEMSDKEPVSEILLSGGVSKSSGARHILNEALGIDCKKINLSELAFKGRLSDVDDSFTVAYGIALRSKNSSDVSSIDFTMDKTSSGKEVRYIFTSLVKVFVMVFILMAFYGADLFIQKNAKEEVLKDYEKRVRASFMEVLPNEFTKGNELQVIKEKIKEAEIQADRVGALLSKGITTLDMLNELSERIALAGGSEEIEIYECSFDGKRLNILGETGSYNLTDKIKKSIEGSDIFGEVKMNYAKFTADEKKVKFSMKIALRQGE